MSIENRIDEIKVLVDHLRMDLAELKLRLDVKLKDVDDKIDYLDNEMHDVRNEMPVDYLTEYDLEDYVLDSKFVGLQDRVEILEDMIQDRGK